MILIVTQTFAPKIGGMEIYMTSLAGKLAGAGHDVMVFADGKQTNDKPQTDYLIRRFRGWRPLRRRKKLRAVQEFFKMHKPNAVLCDSWKSVESLPSDINAPVVVLAHGADCSVVSVRKRERIKQAFSRSRHIIANSAFTANVVRGLLPHPDDPRLCVIHPPIDPLPDPSPEALAWVHGYIGEKGPVLSVVARLEARKGVDCVIGAMPAVLAKYPKALFLVAGGGEDTQRLHALAEEKHVGENVLFLGKIHGSDKKSALLSRSDVFAMPVRRVGTSVEGFGISYIEAAWFGVPSLAGSEGGAQDAVLDEQTGLLCDGDNQTEVTTKLLRLLDDAPLRHRLGHAARVRVTNELLWDQALPRFLSLLG